METLPFTAGDIGILIVLFASGLLAMARGFVSEVLSIAAWIAAALAAIWAYPHLQPFAAQYLQPEILANVAVAAGVFILALILFSAISHRIAATVQRSSIGSLDRILGLAFGLARGGLLVVLAYLALIWVFPAGNRPAWLEQAQFRPFVERGAAWLASVVPAETIGQTLERAGLGDAAAPLGAEGTTRPITDFFGGPSLLPEGTDPAPLTTEIAPQPGAAAPAPAPLPQLEVEIVPTPGGNAGN